MIPAVELLQHDALLFERAACEIMEARRDGARLEPVIVRLARAGRIDRPSKVKPEDLTANSVLLGTPSRIAAALERVEAAGFD